MKTEGSILFRITENEIETQSTQRLTDLLHPEIRGFTGLESLLGNITIRLPESEALHGEPFLCEKTRLFCQKLYEVFPFWGFFFSLNSMSLWKMTLSTLQETRIRQYSRACNTQFQFNDTEIQNHILSLVESLTNLGQKAQITESKIQDRATELQNYFSRLISAHSASKNL